MDFKKIFGKLDIIASCRRYGIPLWQCPQLLFVIMGAVIIVSSLSIFAIGTYFIENPELVALLVLGLSAILFIIATIIIQSFDRLAEANRMKSEFVNIVSHQLRTPITNIKWTLDALSPKIKEKITEDNGYLETLEENTERMTELVNDLITVSRIQEGALPLKQEEFSLETLVKELIHESKPFAEASGVKIETRFEENLPLIDHDSLRIKSVVENLLNNAIHYGFEKKEEELREEKRKIEITLKTKPQNIYFEIKDNGIGIPKEDQKYIFQKFFRAGNVLKHQAQGSGLGLYIAKSIIEKSKGKIGFNSQENEGATFWFTLPIK
jgi:signal transduction histidine kinase